jgi:uncharacterized sulfatase
VIVTSDNGMPFPRAKANLYEYGIHMPLAISWPKSIPAGQDTDDLVSLIDVTRTIFQAAEVAPKQADQMPGRSLLSRYSAERDKTTPPRDAVFSGRERHSSSRYSSLGYPCRCIRTKTHLYIRNFTPRRWPAGTPQKYDKAKFDDDGGLISSKLGASHGGYHDIDNGPTLQWMIANRDQPEVSRLFAAAVDRRPREELYEIKSDPSCMNNLAQQASAKETKRDLARRLSEYLILTGDLRQTDPEAAHVWETYPRVSSLRWFPVPEWVTENPDRLLRQDWLEERRPR